jgi:purine-binding chemotaxis protein CheW
VTEEATTLVHFRVGECDLSLEIQIVDEVIRLAEVADMKRHMAGVQGALTLRGRVIPVIDLARILNIQGDMGDRAIVARGRGQRIILTVDEVIGIYEKPPPCGEVPRILGFDREIIREFHRTDGHVVGWLDLESVFSEHDWEGIRSLSEIEADGLLGDSTLEILGY